MGKIEANGLVVFDVETTGLPPMLGHRIIEIGAVRLENGTITTSFHSLIACGRPISKGAQRVHGITDDMLRGRPPPEEVFENFRAFIGKSMLVAHNARFDRSFLRNEFGRLGWGLPNRMLCTLKLSRRLLPGLPNYRLETVARHLFGRLSADAMQHRALDDANLTAKVWLALEGM